MKICFNILIFCIFFSLNLVQAAEYDLRLLEGSGRETGGSLHLNASIESGLQRQVSETDLLLQSLLQEMSDEALQKERQLSLERPQEPVRSSVEGSSIIDQMKRQMEQMQEQLKAISKSISKEPVVISVKEEGVVSRKTVKPALAKKSTKRKSHEESDEEFLNDESGEEYLPEDNEKDDGTSFLSGKKSSCSGVSRCTSKGHISTTYTSKDGTICKFPDKVFQIPDEVYFQRQKYFDKYLQKIGIVRPEEREPFFKYRRRMSLRRSSQRCREEETLRKKEFNKEVVMQAKVIAALKVRLLEGNLDSSTPVVSDEE